MAVEKFIAELEKRWSWGKRAADNVDTRRGDLIVDFALIRDGEIAPTIALLRRVHGKDWMPSTSVIQQALDDVRKISLTPSLRPERDPLDDWKPTPLTQAGQAMLVDAIRSPQGPLGAVLAKLAKSMLDRDQHLFGGQ